MKVKCPKCGHEFEVEAIPVTYPKIEPDMSGSSLTYPDLGISPKVFLYCGPYKEIHLSCGHIIRCEFAQFHKGQKTWCGECKKEVEVVKCIDTVTGKEYDRL